MSAAVTPYDDLNVNPDPDFNSDDPVSGIYYYCYTYGIQSKVL